MIRTLKSVKYFRAVFRALLVLAAIVAKLPLDFRRRRCIALACPYSNCAIDITRRVLVFPFFFFSFTARSGKRSDYSPDLSIVSYVCGVRAILYAFI